MLDVLLNVLAVIGIIVVGGFVVIFLGNVLLTVLDSDNSKKSRKEPEQQQPTYMIQQGPVPMQIQEPVRLIEEPKPEPVMTQYEDVDFEKAKEEERLLNGYTQPQPQQESAEDAFAKLRAEEEAFRQERLRFIEERRRIEEEERAKQEAEEAQRQKEIDELDLDDIFFDDEEEQEVAPVEETVEQPVVEEEIEEFTFGEEQQEVAPVEEETAPVEETTEEETVDPEIEKIDEELEEIAEELPVEEDKTTDDEKLKELEEELERQRAELEEFKKRAEEERQQLLAEKQELTEKLQQSESKELELSEANLTLEEYEERLATLQERLKANDKELKANKKEYLPLARVRKSLENDKKKLRRREALVAKQKVVLYGVNNYVDIDEEKAKKLAEDLDLLDGLRVSVQHCEEVMAQNAERLPILERTYNILTENQKNLKADIAEVEAKIAEIKAQADGETEGDAPAEGEGENN